MIQDCRLKIEYLRSASLRAVGALRAGSRRDQLLKKIIKKAERSLRLVGVVAPTPRRATSTNLQSSIFNIKFADPQGSLFHERSLGTSIDPWPLFYSLSFDNSYRRQSCHLPGDTGAVHDIDDPIDVLVSRRCFFSQT